MKVVRNLNNTVNIKAIPRAMPALMTIMGIERMMLITAY